MKRNTTLVASLALIAVLGGSLGALAHGKDHGPRGARGPVIEFSDLDTNGDGQITQAEIDAKKAARFAEIDTNGDGSITAEELLAHGEAKRAEREAEGKEINEERKAKMAERKAEMAERLIERMDGNDDGVVSADEFGEGKGGKRGGGDMIERLDANEDGVISEEEFNAAKDRMKERHGGKK